MIPNLHHIECKGPDGSVLDRLLLVTVTREAAERAARELLADRCNLAVDEVAALAFCIVAGLQDKPGEDYRDRQDRKRMAGRWVRKYLALDAEQRRTVLGGLLRASFPGRHADAGRPLAGTIIGMSAVDLRCKTSAELPSGSCIGNGIKIQIAERDLRGRAY